jgi:hypothetical protein
VVFWRPGQSQGLLLAAVVQCVACNMHRTTNIWVLLNRPSVAGAFLQTHLLLIHSFINWVTLSSVVQVITNLSILNLTLVWHSEGKSGGVREDIKKRPSFGQCPKGGGGGTVGQFRGWGQHNFSEIHHQCKHPPNHHKTYHHQPLIHHHQLLNHHHHNKNHNYDNNCPESIILELSRLLEGLESSS